MRFASPSARSGFTLLQLILVVVLIGIVAAFVLPKFGGVKERAFVDAMKNDLRNYALLQEQYFHGQDGEYGTPSEIQAKGFTFSEGVSADSSFESTIAFYLRVKHEKTDTVCELLYARDQAYENAPNRVLCPGAGAGELSVDLSTSGEDFTVFQESATYSASAVQQDGALLGFRVSVRQPDGASNVLCQKSSPMRAECGGGLPTDMPGVHTLTASAAMGGASLDGASGSGLLKAGSSRLRASDSATYEVVNNAPFADFSFSPSNPTTLETVNFDASASMDLEGSIASYRWSFGDGDTLRTGPQGTHSYTDDGNYQVELVVRDGFGKPDTARKSVPVTNQAPGASFTADPTTATPDEAIALDGSASFDVDGSVDDYRWRFDGGSATAWSSQPTETTSFSSTGEHSVELQVRDDDGDVSGWVSQTVTIENQAPTASFTYSPSSPSTDETITLDGSGSSDPDGPVADYRWRFDGGSASSWSSQATTTTSFGSDGSHTLELQVRDEHGATSGWVAQSVSVQNRPPSADFTFSPSSPQVSQSVTFDGSSSFDPDGRIEKFRWDFGDGETGSGEVVTHSFDSPDSYNVRLTVTDDDGNQASKPESVAVSGTYACSATPSDSVYDSSSQSGVDNMTVTADASDPSNLHFEVKASKYQFGVENTWDGTCSGHHGGIRSNSLTVSGGAAEWNRSWADAHEEQSFEWTSEGCAWKPSSAAQIATLGSASGVGDPSNLEYWAYAGNNDQSVVRVDVPEPSGSSWSRTFDITSSGANDQSGSVTFSCSLQ